MALSRVRRGVEKKDWVLVSPSLSEKDGQTRGKMNDFKRLPLVFFYQVPGTLELSFHLSFDVLFGFFPFLFLLGYLDFPLALPGSKCTTGGGLEDARPDAPEQSWPRRNDDGGAGGKGEEEGQVQRVGLRGAAGAECVLCFFLLLVLGGGEGSRCY